MKRQLAGAAALLLASACYAQGYFNFDDIPGINSQPNVQIDLNEATLGFVFPIVEGTDPAAADALRGIENVRLRVFEEVDDAEEFLEFIDDTSGALERDGWQRVVYVEDHGSKVRMYMKFDDSVASGLTVMVADSTGDGAVLVNIAGAIDPQKLGQVMRAVGAGEFMSGVSGSIPGVTGTALDPDEDSSSP
ncbi:MAG: DUF4252 domain-containing protein [Gammaproteobacteria bacterium]|jgi:hypothetical protein